MPFHSGATPDVSSTIVSGSRMIGNGGNVRAHFRLLWSGQISHRCGTLLDLSRQTTCFGHWSFMSPENDPYG